MNADSIIGANGDLTSNNLFAYCSNNPVMLADPSGYCSRCGNLSYNAASMSPAAWERHVAMYPVSTVGSAKPYQSVSGGPNTPNCYAYAIGVSNALNPGDIRGVSPTKWYDVNDVASSVMADIEKMGRSVRTIESYNSPIYDNEYRIALRVGTQPYMYYYGSPIYDYHFMVQTSSGQWAEKHGTRGSSLIWAQGYNPTTIPWTVGNKPYYDSPIVYFAIGG